ncbi:MAG TPA: lipid A biosynthesis acyltransferase [Gammaproteobacteria bacterium]|nr:lipid A biosynthesis acyltransferase [Gammaproteobacteria bacterium]HAU06177.1 lipid A biosynthesis acyltransferase [Gammaproteobacteria bacterium]
MKVKYPQFVHPRFWPSWGVLMLMRLAVYLPKPIQHSLTYLIAIVMQPFTRKRQRIAERNLMLCFPEWSKEKRHRLLKENMHKTAGMLIETAMSWWAHDKVLAKRADYQGLEHLTNALAKGKGVILLTGHFTSMEMGGRLMMQKVPCHVMFRPVNNRLLNHVMMRAREHHSEGIILREDPRAMLRALRKNKVVWYAPDQDFGPKPSIFVPFFGRPAATVPAVSRMAKMSGAAVIPFVPKQGKDGDYTLTLSAPIEDFPTDDEYADTARINAWFEQVITEIPEQYYWVHRRFKTQENRNKGDLYN